MSIEEKFRILEEMFKILDVVDEKDKGAVLGYIRATKDTRERIEMEKKSV